MISKVSFHRVDNLIACPISVLSDVKNRRGQACPELVRLQFFSEIGPKIWANVTEFNLKDSTIKQIKSKQ